VLWWDYNDDDNGDDYNDVVNDNYDDDGSKFRNCISSYMT